ncbi:hypothetical protein KIN20_004260 [Parelaphostrongylus tenuis]|uniref:Uncharacterized protein n=1 Tax=Parelaphostrongylus tenuis TaxID=148309 RepID=A0AAD5QHY1_PARTN|nr:hypothetical protein KIN20_004260 [Parelaphostrongylus tenuis]
MFAPMLRRLDALSCSMPEDMDVLLFVPSISTRIASQLQITWRQNDRHAKSLAECYLALKHERQDILKGKKARFTAKTFSSGEEGKEIVISELDSAKSLTIRDYNDHHRYRTLGFIVGRDH